MAGNPSVRSSMAARYVARRLFSGKILSEEEKAAENVYIKKMEQEKLEKLARKGVNTEGQPSATAAGDVKPSGAAASSSTSGVSTDKNRNYAVVAGTVTALSALGWYLLSKPKKTEETAD
ncbi:hypothetical protein J5N97_012188 [Dioscorea zingiberensis]|uniref:F1F0-ATPase inhibitor protein n=1 Tax=Dioscorea zingiberensis TaxID=325984 RepID=A0A9D5HHJ6_9LILI|nr:hypothetical protein J5N97_012188 [Dioscorea zingiberensis]